MIWHIAVVTLDEYTNEFVYSHSTCVHTLENKFKKEDIRIYIKAYIVVF